MSAGLTVPRDTILRQARASDPRASAWVGANAGSGKTYVLTRRVVRLLLQGTDPGRILCLTFTKAAAAQMATKVFDTLAKWTRLDDAELLAELRTMEDDVGPEMPRRARRLFARALETPGGLKIQTIHAFCEALLHQFPLEANVAGHFEVVDDRGQAELLAEAQAELLHHVAADPHGPLGTALATVMDHASDMVFLEAIGELVARRHDFGDWIAANGSFDSAIDNLRQSFGLSADDTIPALLAAYPQSPYFDQAYVGGLSPALEASGKSDNQLAGRFRDAALQSDPERRADAWLAVFFTAAGKPRSRFATKKIIADFPDIEDRFESEVARLADLRDRHRASITVTATEAIGRLAQAVIQGYESRKAARGFLDFDDLVARTADLLSRSDAARWVQYKLDLGLDHVLIDEGQDTSPRQWQVIRQLVGEFFAGEGARSVAPTIFAVGDEKQSIYSFQGAAPRLFGEMRRRFLAEAEAAESRFHDERLYLSFRSTPDVLAAVDTVFADERAHAGLTVPAEPTTHEAARAHDPGLVEMWPLIAVEEAPAPEDWRQPLDHEGPAEPARRLAVRIAETIAGWLGGGERLAGTGRRIAPGDILVLVGKRGPFVEALNRALKDCGVPAAGSDRLVVTDHIAVEDLISFARAVLLPADDLSLAEALKSPILGLDEDALFELAHARPRGQPLDEALFARREEGVFTSICDLISVSRRRAATAAPYEFYSSLLAAGGARGRFRARLGAEVDEVLDEFLSLALAYEQSAAPTLEGFIAWLALSPAEIKRQQDSEAREVRVMTVHGAKGLEAPVVFLVDSCAQPFHASHRPRILPFDQSDAPGDPPALVWTPRGAAATRWYDSAVAGYQARQEEEYRRLLYVAMTRAADRLIMCGYRGKNEPRGDIWYNLVCDALMPGAEPVSDQDGETIAWRWHHSGLKPREAVDETVPAARDAPLPSWLSAPVAPPPLERHVSPSRALAEALEARDPAGAGEIALETGLDNRDAAMRRGLLVHQLLEHLPLCEAGDRPSLARRILDHAAPDTSGQVREKLLSEVFGVLDDPAFAEIFTADSRAEVTIAGSIEIGNEKSIAVSGQIDRLVVYGDTVLIVDYKSNLEIPAEAPEEYVLQLALYGRLLADLYPAHAIRAGLLWTRAPRLAEIPASTLSETLERYIASL